MVYQLGIESIQTAWESCSSRGWKWWP